ncbi:glycosyltransferase, partial [Candidatus Woesearchaeota archaeon]|nr:glycosyltransferase [Candidatus Woesearchaeota archaeon]
KKYEIKKDFYRALGYYCTIIRWTRLRRGFNLFENNSLIKKAKLRHDYLLKNYVWIKGKIPKISKENKLYLDYIKNNQDITKDRYFGKKFSKKDFLEKLKKEMLILKKFNKEKRERGVLYITWDLQRAFPIIFNLDKISQKYYLVIETNMCTIPDETFYSYINGKLDIILILPDERDYIFFKKIKSNIVIDKDLGSGNWTDTYIFINNADKKIYDFAFVGNISQRKRHELFLKAISYLKEKRNIKVTLFNISSKYKEYINNLIKKYNLQKIVEVYFKSNKRPLKHISKNKIFVHLSDREGQCRSIGEALSLGLPVIINKNIKGENLKYINKKTGVLSDDDELPEKMIYMLENYKKFRPREWKLKNANHILSTNKLNKILKDIAKKRKHTWTKDIITHTFDNDIRYLKEEDKKIFDKEYELLLNYLRRY